MPCLNARADVTAHFSSLAERHYVGQQQSWHFVTDLLDRYSGFTPRATCADWTLHFTGPSGSGKSFLAELIATAAFEPFEDEYYSLSQYSAGGAGTAVGGALGWFVGGPFGTAIGATVGAYGTQKAWDAAYSMSTSLRSSFRAPKPFPSQCGVVQHKFARGSGVAEVRQWEHRVAKELARDPASIIIVDDVGRLNDEGAFEELGRLLCGSGGNAIPEFRTGPDGEGGALVVPAAQALFILTSDLELDPTEVSVSCETDAWEPMLDAVRSQSDRFWGERNLTTPDWWEQIQMVPFRELCADELAEVTRKYLGRQAELATQQVEAYMQRRSSWALGAQRELRWIGAVKHGARSAAALDAFIADSAASAKLTGGRQGGWVVADFHRAVMRPALQALVSDHDPASGVRAIVSGAQRAQTNWRNYTTVTYSSPLCLEIVARDADAPGAMPRVRFTPMHRLCQ